MSYDELKKLLGRKEEEAHLRAYRETGFWGRQAAGCLFFSLESRRFGFAKRSRFVLDPGTHGTVGGAVNEGEPPEQTVLREVVEEVGYDGPHELRWLDLFQSGSFRYSTYLMLVPQEFAPALNWENDGFLWVPHATWPDPVHPGLAVTLAKPNVREILDALAGLR
ncbi:MAG: NUDIX domain-containing protein [Alphaproteobacteria bacterium]